MNSPIDVYKFGGAAVGSAEAIRIAVDHVKRGKRVAVIVSAMNGITDLLINAGHAAVAGDREACEQAARDFQQRHTSLLPQLFGSEKQRRELRKLIDEAVAQMRAMTDSISVLREFTSRAHDSMAARGERL